MPFQTQVFEKMAVALYGTIARADPTVYDVKQITSDSAKNEFGLAVVAVSETAVQVGADGLFAGVLMSPHSHGRDGDSPQFYVNKNSDVDVLSMGTAVVQTETAIDISSKDLFVYYNTDNGKFGQAAAAAAKKIIIDGAKFVIANASSGQPAYLSLSGIAPVIAKAP